MTKLARSLVQVYDECFDDVYRYVYFRIGNKWDADDVVSEVFTRSYQSFNRLKGDARAWVFAIAHHAVVDHYRRRGREVPFASPPELPVIDEHSALERNAETKCLEQALGALSTQQRELIAMRYFANLQHRQIAGVLKTTDGAIKMRLGRLLEQVKGMMEECMR